MIYFEFKTYAYNEELGEFTENVTTEIDMSTGSACTEPVEVSPNELYSIHGNFSDVQIHVSTDGINWSVQDIVQDEESTTYILEPGDHNYVRILVVSGEGKIHYTIE